METQSTLRKTNLTQSTPVNFDSKDIAAINLPMHKPISLNKRMLRSTYIYSWLEVPRKSTWLRKQNQRIFPSKHGAQKTREYQHPCFFAEVTIARGVKSAFEKSPLMISAILCCYEEEICAGPVIVIACIYVSRIQKVVSPEFPITMGVPTNFPLS